MRDTNPVFDNPNRIHEVGSYVKRMTGHYGVFSRAKCPCRTAGAPCLASGACRLYRNAGALIDAYSTICIALRDDDLEALIPYLTIALEPVFDDGKIELTDSHFGGVTDVRHCLDFQPTRYSGFTYFHENWPRCGCCHDYLQPIGQFDLSDWVVPIQSVFGLEQQLRGQKEVMGPFGAGADAMDNWGPEETVYHLFACSGVKHSHEQGPDVRLLVSRRTAERRRLAPRRELADNKYRQLYDDFVSAHVLKGEGAEYLNPHQQPRRIRAWQIRFALEHFHPSEIGVDAERVVVFEDSYPDLLHVGTQRPVGLLGVPQSQQTVQRYCSQDVSNGLKMMTPFLSYYDETHDTTWQMWVDFHTGWPTNRYYGKVQCTNT